jgi:hypothetical protein
LSLTSSEENMALSEPEKYADNTKQHNARR